MIIGAFLYFSSLIINDYVIPKSGWVANDYKLPLRDVVGLN